MLLPFRPTVVRLPGAINVTRDGVIDINGTGSAQNIGLMGINGAKGLVNSGTINLNGYSASGIELQGSQALHSGTINITNGSTTDNSLKYWRTGRRGRVSAYDEWGA